jgi:putative transposase
MLLIIARVPRSSYYYHLKYNQEPEKHLRERDEIQRICNENKGCYGYRRVTIELRHRGFQTNHKLVMKLMQQAHLTCKLREKKYRSYRGQLGKVAPNLLKRDFRAEKPNSKWTTDITEFRLMGQKLYLSPIMDLFNGEIISYTLSKSATFHQVTEMLENAFQKVPGSIRLILHSDQGWQYQMRQYQKMLKEKGVRQSMSRKGNCYDNSVMESFFGILKSEFYHNQKFSSVEHFTRELSEYIDYYNNRRIKVKLNGLSPVQFRTQSFISTKLMSNKWGAHQSGKFLRGWLFVCHCKGLLSLRHPCLLGARRTHRESNQGSPILGEAHCPGCSSGNLLLISIKESPS